MIWAITLAALAPPMPLPPADPVDPAVVEEFVAWVTPHVPASSRLHLATCVSSPAVREVIACYAIHEDADDDYSVIAAQVMIWGPPHQWPDAPLPAFTFDVPPAAPGSSVPGSARTSFGSGTWLVGVDIAPGIYRTEVEALDFGDLEGMPVMSNCEWARLSGLSGSYDEEIASQFLMTPGPAIVEILDTDVAFRATDCGTWTLVTS